MAKMVDTSNQKSMMRRAMLGGVELQGLSL
jgi:hypothetical protein